MPTSKSAEVRAKLDHPVIDSDGHMIEFEPGFLDYLKQEGGDSMVKRFLSPERNSGGWGRLFRWYALSPEERLDQRATRSPVVGACPQRTPWTAQPLCCPSCCPNGWRSSAWILPFCIRRLDSCFHILKIRNCDGQAVAPSIPSMQSIFREYASQMTPAARYSHAHAAGGD